MENDNLKNEQQYTASNVSRSFGHNVSRIVGGKYYEAKTDTTYWYAGKIKLFIGCKWYNVKRRALLMWYDIKIWWLKNFA